MNSTALLITAGISLLLAALSGWAWIAARRFGKERRNGFEGMHFDT